MHETPDTPRIPNLPVPPEIVQRAAGQLAAEAATHKGVDAQPDHAAAASDAPTRRALEPPAEDMLTAPPIRGRRAKHGEPEPKPPETPEPAAAPAQPDKPARQEEQNDQPPELDTGNSVDGPTDGPPPPEPPAAAEHGDGDDAYQPPDNGIQRFEGLSPLPEAIEPIREKFTQIVEGTFADADNSPYIDQDGGTARIALNDNAEDGITITKATIKGDEPVRLTADFIDLQGRQSHHDYYIDPRDNALHRHDSSAPVLSATIPRLGSMPTSEVNRLVEQQNDAAAASITFEQEQFGITDPLVSDQELDHVLERLTGGVPVPVPLEHLYETANLRADVSSEPPSDQESRRAANEVTAYVDYRIVKEHGDPNEPQTLGGQVPSNTNSVFAVLYGKTAVGTAFVDIDLTHAPSPRTLGYFMEIAGRHPALLRGETINNIRISLKYEVIDGMLQFTLFGRFGTERRQILAHRMLEPKKADTAESRMLRNLLRDPYLEFEEYDEEDE